MTVIEGHFLEILSPLNLSGNSLATADVITSRPLSSAVSSSSTVSQDICTGAEVTGGRVSVIRPSAISAAKVKVSFPAGMTTEDEY